MDLLYDLLQGLGLVAFFAFALLGAFGCNRPKSSLKDDPGQFTGDVYFSDGLGSVSSLAGTERDTAIKKDPFLTGRDFK